MLADATQHKTAKYKTNDRENDRTHIKYTGAKQRLQPFKQKTADNTDCPENHVVFYEKSGKKSTGNHQNDIGKIV